MRRNLHHFFCWLALFAAAATGCRGPHGDQVAGPNSFRQASGPQQFWNPFTKEKTPDAQVASSRSEAPPDWRSLQAMMPEDAISLAKPLAPGADLYVKAAQLYEARSRFPQAIEQYNKALELDAQYLPALIGLARLYDRHGHPAEALQMYQKAANFHPDNGTVFNDMGLCYSKQGLWQEAMVNLDRAVQLQPKNRLYRNNIAKVLITNRRSNDAFQHLNAVFPAAESHYNVGFMAHEIGDDVAAQQHLALAIQSSPDLLAARDLLVQVTSAQNNNQQNAFQQDKAPATGLAENDRQRFAPQLDGPRLAPTQDQAHLNNLRLDVPHPEAPQFRPTSGPTYSPQGNRP